MVPTDAPRPLRVALGEDDVLLREGIARILVGAGMDVVVRSGDADDLLRRASACRPDVVLADVQMPPDHTDDGLRAALELRRRLPGTGVLILSLYEDGGRGQEDESAFSWASVRRRAARCR
jgi:DNA-binding NarL/FixJ family response regulator